jgi:hypothetical protein
METQSRLKNCYCFDRSFKRDAAKIEALRRFEQEERLWRDQPRAASVRLVEPRDTPYFWAIIVISDLSKAKVLEMVDPGTSVASRDDRLSFEVLLDTTHPLMVETERRTLEYKQVRFGGSEISFGCWVRVN